MNISQNWVSQFSCLFFFFFITTLYSQKRYHSEYNGTVNQILKTLHYETNDNVDSLNAILKHSNNVCMQTLALHYDASIDYLLRNELDKAEKKSLECIERAKVNQSKMDSDCYRSIVRMSATRLFYIYRRKAEYDKAFKVVLAHKKEIEYSEFLSFLAINQFDLQHYNKAIEKFNLCLRKTQPEHPDYLSRTANIHNFLGDTFIQEYKKTQNKNYLDSADKHYRMSFVNGNKFNKNDSYNSALYNSRLAKTEYYKNNHSKAISFYKLYFDHPIMQENSFTYQAYCIGLAENYLQLKKADLALKYLIKLDSAYVLKSGTEQFYIEGLSAYMDAYQQKGDDNKALHYAKLYLNEIKKLESSKEKAHEVMSLFNIKESNEKAQQIINSKNRWLIFLFITGIVLSIIIGAIYIHHLQTSKKNASSMQIITSVEEQTELKDIALSLKLTKENSEKSKYLTDNKGFEQMQKKLLRMENSKEFLNPDFKLSYLAKKLGTNTAYLSAFFNDYLNKGFSQYVQEKRIEYLLKLLDNEKIYHKYTVQAISEHIGYKSTSAFTKIFKKHTGENFSSYLERLRFN
ncbi:helix-turn-helix domain-containing protein [Chryseobacterium aahli]|uniref:helix-turn-helix domain-containing protein n=1 Tax=Chryseobacterium aahli TaxID=1278643 RepID=UPI001F60CD33|nr:helix-turn-helix domain-containing protein [Chryseobacterium aahli]MCI3938799.1 helix-turn-helix domain-containing protein [Chryseobacterium aahli]